jgi:hypothetical protein
MTVVYGLDGRGSIPGRDRRLVDDFELEGTEALSNTKILR